MKTFSIALTYFQRPKLLSRALYCLLQQTYKAFDVIPVFAGPDPEAEFLYRQFQAKVADARFRDLVIMPRGVPERHGNDLRYDILAYCHNDYVIWYGHDCLVDKDYLETHANQIQDDLCISVVGQRHFTEHDHDRRWLTYRTDLPQSTNPNDFVIQELDLLNFAVPVAAARSWAFDPRLRHRYEADWFTFRDIRRESGLPVRVSPKLVCAHF
jgi:GT2 family glycosyltransferase